MCKYVRMVLIIWLTIRKETGAPHKRAGYIFSRQQKDTSSDSALNEAHLDIPLKEQVI